MTDDLGRLGDAVRQRRTQELRISAREAAARAGISRNAWVGIEGARNRPQERNRAGIEDVLGWAPGSIAAILAGGEPTPADRSATAPDADLDERLVAEIERIQALPMSADHRLRMIRALVCTYEDARRAREQAAAQQGEQPQAS
jgi:hypothetical protein